ncbi:MAG: hypothetical protein HRU09_09360 [Oligoflexales bacterium]|nr:hypothetical protein [Oligoflexales bacterium]
MGNKMLISFIFTTICLLNAWPQSFAAPKDIQLNSYTVFDVKQLSFGKNVTVGKYVLAYIPLGEDVTIQAANPPQRLDVRLQWLNQKADHRKLKILGEWVEADRRLTIGVKLGRKLHASKAPMSHHGDKGMILVKGSQANLISLPLMADHPVKVFADKKKLGGLNQKLRIVVSSNKAFQIQR